MRLDKFIGAVTQLSRREVQQQIKSGAVYVNDQLARSGAQTISESDRISFNGQRLEPLRPRYLMLHKPAGYVCANSDSQHPTVLDLIDEPRKHQLQIVGRLDVDTTGLVLITDDGQWNHRLTSPRRQCTKVYRLSTAEPLHEELIGVFARGLLLQGEKKLTLPARLEILGSQEARLSIQEGKYHQVKRMLAAVGNRVTRLHREAVGEIQLDPQLAPGTYRHLTEQEIHHG